MRKIYLLPLLLLLCSLSSIAQVTVSGSTGANGTYASLSQAGGAFAAINAAGSQAGNNVLITITADVATEDGFAQLNSGGWTTLTINPSGARTISGNTAAAIIGLNGATNVTIDGLNSGGNSLAISNSSTTTLASTISFTNDASNNTVNRCNLSGSAGTGGRGTLYFGLGATTGNNNNLISNCNLSAAAGGTPLNAIYSIGTVNNSSNTITQCNISDYFNASNSCAGINLGIFNSGWTITNNTFYQTATRTFTSSNTHYAIFISSGSGYTISNNVIGYATPAATGTTNMIGLTSGSLGGTFPSSFTSGGTANATRYIGISCAFTAGGAVSSIQNNKIGGIALYTSSGATTTNGILCGIAVTSGNANIGTVTGNTIGSSTTAGSLYAASTSGGGVISGIYCTTTNTINIQNNIIGGIDASGISATTGQGFKGIDAAGTGTYTISNNIVGNTVTNNIRTGYLLTGANLSNAATTPTSTSGGAAIQGILCSATGATQSITNNTLRGFQMSNSNSTFTGINTTGAATSSIDVSNNNLGTAGLGLLNIMFANSGQILCQNNSGGSSTCAFTANNNLFTGISYAVECSGTFRCMNNSATLLSATFNNNNFNNITVNSSAQTFGFLIGATSNTPTVVMTGNYITTQFTNSTTTGASNLFAIGCASSTPATGSTTITNNNFSNISFKTTTSFGAVIYWLDGNATGSTHNINISNNTITNITNTGTASTAGLYALTVGYGNTNTISNNVVSGISSIGQTIAILANPASVNTSGSFAVNNNTVFNVNSSATASNAQGIQVAAGPTQNIYKNKIYDINNTSTGNAIGIVESQAAAGTVTNIYNNYVGRIYASTSTASNAVLGISLGSTVVNTTNVYYNTVYLDGNVPNHSVCLSMGSSVPVVNSRNNIFSNNCTATGSLEQMAIFRTGSLSGTYATSSNNNILWCGTPGSLNIIYGDGAFGAVTNKQQTLAAFKTFMGGTRENLSMTENPPFLNTATGANANYLHINTAVATQVESGAVNISGFTDDYDGDIRQGNPGYAGTSTVGPDIGADEGEFIAADALAPVITNIVASNNACDLTSRIITATIIDATGVNNAGFKPKIYFRKNGGSYFSLTGSLTSGSVKNGTWTFTITYATVGGVIATDLIEYFIVAQDVNTPTFNVGGNPSAGLTLTDVNTINTPPTTPYSYNILTSMSGTYLVGVGQTSPNYATLTAAIADYNTRCISGPVIFELQDALYSASETFPIVINANSDASAVNTLTIQPKTGVASVISANNATSLIDFTGAKYIRINGLNSGGASLLIRNTNSTVPAIRLQNDAVYNIITNSTFESSNTSFTTTTSAAIIFLTSTGTLGNSNNTISYCNFRDRTDISATPRVLIMSSGSAAPQNANNTIDHCNIYNFYQNGLSAFGIYLNTGSTDWTISNNSFYQTGTLTSTTTGTTLIGVFTSSPLGNNMSITGNYFGGSTALCGGSALTLTTATAGVSNSIDPIYMSAVGTTTPSTIQNNTIQNISLTTMPTGANAFPFTPILASTGSYIIDGNLMGSGTGNGSITVNNSGALTSSFFCFIEAMELSATGSLVVTNNTIGSYNLGGTNTASLTAFRGMLITGTPTSVSISNNLIGSNTTANSIQNTVAARVSPFLVMLPSMSNGTTVNISNNTIRNLTNSSSNTNANNYFVGLNLAGNGPYNITGNTLQELTTSSGLTTSTPGSNAMTGIFQSSTGTGHVISGNTITGLRSVPGAATTSVYGIAVNGAGSTGSVLKNNINDLTNTSTSTTSRIYGTDNFAGSTWTFANNMTSITNAANTNAIDIQGMREETGAGTTANYYFNSVHIGGSAAASAINTYAFNRAANTTVTIKDNIFSNTRTGGTGYHVAMANTSASSTGWSGSASDYNDLYSSTAANVTQWLGAAAGNNLTFAGWQAAQPGGSGGDANSLNRLPAFTSASTGDLHLTTSNCGLDGYGTPIASYTTDYDGQTRDAATPDMGADEFTSTPGTTLAGVAGSAVCSNKTVSASGTTYTTSTCDLIARILPSGGAAVGGKINTCVTLDATQQFFNAEPYVQRHFDIEPTTSNTTTTSATITLYFTDAEFVQFNTNNPAWPKLPTVAGGGNTDPNRANLKVTQYHGTATTSPSTPGNYSAGGAGILITPGAANVFWNGSYWAVTFNITGFSGFYVHSNPLNPLSVVPDYIANVIRNRTKGVSLLNIAPNPVRGNTLKLRSNANTVARMNIKIADVQGRIMKETQIRLSSGSNVSDIDVSNLAPGTYQLYGDVMGERTSVLRFVKL